MAVQHPAQDVGDRLLHVRPGHQDRKDRRDVARPFGPGARPFGQPHDRLVQRGREAAQRRVLSPRKRHLAMRFGKAGHAVDQKQHLLPLVAKMFGHRHRGQGAGPAHQRRLVRRGGHHDAARHAGRAKHPFREFAQFAAAFADQGDHHDIGLNPTREPGQKRRFANARPRKQPDPLPPDQRQQRVEHGNASVQPIPQATARCGGGRGRAQGAGPRAAKQRTTVQRLTRRVDDAADPAVIRGDLGPAQQLDPVGNRHAVAGGIRQHRTASRRQAQHLAPCDPVAAVDQDPVTDGSPVQPRHLGKAASGFAYPANPRDRGGLGDFGKKTIKHTGHGILPLFALNRF